jgi:hypothetical protein
MGPEGGVMGGHTLGPESPKRPRGWPLMRVSQGPRHRSEADRSAMTLTMGPMRPQGRGWEPNFGDPTPLQKPPLATLARAKV